MLRSLTAALTFSSLVAFVIPVEANTIPISGTVSGTETTGAFTPSGSNEVATSTFSASGMTVGVPSPPFTETGSSTVTAIGPTFLTSTNTDGTFTATHSNGELFGTFTGTGVDVGGVDTITFSDVFTGGTGFYAGATGSATQLETVDLATGAFTATFTGTLNTTPLPSTWALFLTGFLGLGFFAFRISSKSFSDRGSAAFSEA
jgi:hypothetical protein